MWKQPGDFAEYLATPERAPGSRCMQTLGPLLGGAPEVLITDFVSVLKAAGTTAAAA